MPYRDDEDKKGRVIAVTIVVILLIFGFWVGLQ